MVNRYFHSILYRSHLIISGEIIKLSRDSFSIQRFFVCHIERSKESLRLACPRISKLAIEILRVAQNDRSLALIPAS